MTSDNASPSKVMARIVAAGYSESGSHDFALARYNPDGTLDTSFNPAGSLPGTVTTDFSGSGSGDEAYAVAIQGDGKIVAAGRSNAGGSYDFALARYNPDGTLDTTFNSTGKVLTDFSGSGSIDNEFAVAIQTDGKIVAAGFSTASGKFDFALARYTTSGALDPTFNSTGKVLTDFGGSGGDLANAVAIQRDGKVVAAGESAASGISFDFALARYNPDGTLDTTFNSTGKVLTDFSGSGSDDEAFAVAIQRDGKIVAAGYSNANVSYDFALARYTTGGALDTTFNSTGKVLTDFSGSGSNDIGQGVAIQGDGKIVAAGYSNASGSPDFALARYNR